MRVRRSQSSGVQTRAFAHRLHKVLEDHPGVAGMLKTRDPLGPHSLALAEAFLAPLHNAGFSHRDTGLAYFLILGYTIGFEVSSTRISVNEQRVQDAATRQQLHEFFRSLPDDRFPTLVAPGRARLARQPRRAIRIRPQRAHRRAGPDPAPHTTTQLIGAHHAPRTASAAHPSQPHPPRACRSAAPAATACATDSRPDL